MTAIQFELLIRMSEKQDLMYDLLINHLAHHQAYNIALTVVVVSLIGGIIAKFIWTKKKENLI